MTSEKFIELLEDSGQEVGDYSGRGMYGEKCVAMTIEENDLISVVAAAVEVVAVNYLQSDPDLVREFVSLLSQAKTDSMGRSEIVIYWPSMKWEQGE
jgi:hypothetical protein